MTDKKSRRVLIINNIKSDNIDQAIFILKNDSATKASNTSVSAEAQDIIDDDGELIILSVVEDEDGEVYLEPIEDENLFNKIGDIFEERLSEYFEFAEEE